MIVRVLLIAALLVPTVASAQDLSASLSAFDQGNRHYDQGEFEAAIEAYGRALNAGFASGALYYNMGNAYFRLDDLGQTIRYYEKALRLIPDSPELQHNLEIARAQTADRFSRLPDPFWRPLWRSVETGLGASGLYIIGLLFYLAACAVVALRIRTGLTAWRRRILAVATVGALCFILLGFISSTGQAKHDEAVVLADEVVLLEEPDGVRSDIRVHEGLVVTVVSVTDAWREVRLPNGALGWLRADALGEI